MSKVEDALARNHPTGGGCLKCPWCGEFTTSRIVNTNKRLLGTVRRKHVCNTCQKSFQSVETVSKRLDA